MKNFKNKKKIYKKKICEFCLNNIHYLDFKNLEIINKLINLHGKILPSRVSGNCAKHQRICARAVKRARIMALIPFTMPRIRK